MLDDDKHYWVGNDEVDKLLRRGGAWLGTHPERELIANRYLRHDATLTREAVARLQEDDADDPEQVAETQDAEEEVVERPLSLNEQRLAAVIRRHRRQWGPSGTRPRLRPGQADRRSPHTAVDRSRGRTSTSPTGRSRSRRGVCTSTP